MGEAAADEAADVLDKSGLGAVGEFMRFPSLPFPLLLGLTLIESACRTFSF